jgi:hypothetical protein
MAHPNRPAVASFRLMHCRTGAVLGGYRVLSASQDEIARANHKLRTTGSEYRFVIDLHPPQQTAAPVCNPQDANHPDQATTAVPA